MDPLTIILIFSSLTVIVGIVVLGLVCLKLISAFKGVAELQKASTLTELIEVEERRAFAKDPPKQPLLEQEAKRPTIRLYDGREVPMSELEPM